MARKESYRYIVSKGNKNHSVDAKDTADAKKQGADYFGCKVSEVSARKFNYQKDVKFR